MLLSENMCLLSPFYKSTIFPVFESRGANLSFNESCMLSSSSPARNSGFNPFLYTSEKFSKRSLKSSHQGISKQLTSSFCSMQNTYSFIFSEETYMFSGSTPNILDCKEDFITLVTLSSNSVQYPKDNLVLQKQVIIPNILKLLFANTVGPVSVEKASMTETKNLTASASKHFPEVGDNMKSMQKEPLNQNCLNADMETVSPSNDCDNVAVDVCVTETFSDRNGCNVKYQPMHKTKTNDNVKRPKDLQYVLFERKSSHKKGRPSSKKQKKRQKEKERKKNTAYKLSVPTYGNVNEQVPNHFTNECDLLSFEISYCFPEHSSLSPAKPTSEPFMFFENSADNNSHDCDKDDVDFIVDFKEAVHGNESVTNLATSKFFLSADEFDSDSDESSSDDDWDTVSTINSNLEDDELLSMFSTGLQVCQTENGSIYGKTSSHEDFGLCKKVTKIEKANAKWDSHYTSDLCENKDIKVCFSEDPPSVLLVDRWIGNPLDKERFRRRISESEAIISPVLSSCHRQKTWQKLEAYENT